MVENTPGRHHVGVIHGDDVDSINALGLELINTLDQGRNVLLVANRGVGTRDRDNHDLLALPLVVRLKGGGDTADLTRVELRSPGNETELGVRNDSAFLSSLEEVRIRRLPR